MDYVSTRGAAPTLGFADALLAGLARDGGLYVPLSVPHLPPDAIRALRGDSISGSDRADSWRPSSATISITQK